MRAEYKKNESSLVIGEKLENWQIPAFPSKVSLRGTYCILEPLDPDLHADCLFEKFQQDESGWTYLSYGPFSTYSEFYAWLVTLLKKEDVCVFAILDKGKNFALGMASYLRINPQSGSAEIGYINFSNELRKTAIATEAIYKMINYIFELGYRRCEWKCDSLNQASQKAAERFGFTFEGIFRQHMIYKNRNRDTAWYSIIDSEWSTLKEKFERWLSPDNFYTNGQQRIRLQEL